MALLFAAITSAVIFSISQLGMPWAVRTIIDDGLLRSDRSVLGYGASVLCVLALLSTISLSAHTLALTVLSERALQELRAKLFDHLQKLPMSYFDAHHSAEIASLFTQDAPTAYKIYQPVLSDVILGVIQLISIVGVMVVKYNGLVWLSIAVIPVYVVVPLVTGRATKRGSSSLLQAKAAFNAVLQERVEGVREIKALTCHSWSSARFRQMTANVCIRQIRLMVLTTISSLNYAFYWMSIAFLYWYCGLRVLHAELSIGELVALVWYLGLLDSPVRRFLAVNNNVQTARAGAARVSEFLAAREEIEKHGRVAVVTAPHNPAPKVEFRNVRFRYPGQTRDALAGISFTAERDTTIGIVGPNGSGKTTVVRLLLRFYDAQQGEIFVDGKHVEDYELNDIRQKISVVFQDPFIFCTSIRDNISLAASPLGTSTEANTETVTKSCSFIRQLPNGEDTEIGERGIRLSAGQRQRIAIARSFVRDPQILVWDEATAALDAQSAEEIRAAMAQLMRGRTTFIIAHDLRAIRDCTSIVVLEEGSIVGIGTHEELLRRCELYAQMWASQSSAESQPLEVTVTNDVSAR